MSDLGSIKKQSSDIPEMLSSLQRSRGHNVSSIFSHLEAGIGFESGRIFLAATKRMVKRLEDV